MDIPSFLRRYPPFDELNEELLGEVLRHTHIEFFPAGTIVLHQSGEPSHYLYVVRKGAVEVLGGTMVTDLLGEGEVFGHFSMLSGLGPAFTIRALEDTICYLVDKPVAIEVMGTRRGLAFLSSTLRRREVRALEGVETGGGRSTTTVAALIRRSPITCSIATSVQEAAQIMAEQRVSCLPIPHSNGIGILTDRDLRSRVLAKGRMADTVVGEVMTFPARTIPKEATVSEVILEMLELGVHHFPVVDAEGELVGVVTDTDLLGLELTTPFWLKSAIERAASEDSVVEAARELPEAICTLVEAGADPLHVAQIVSVTRDTIARRFIELGVSGLGDPPAPWAWLALGSEARYEQAFLTDQDHALAYDPRQARTEMVDPYFAQLAEGVTAKIEETGVRRCRAGVIASNREWRRPVPEWVFQFQSWMADPGRTGSAFTGIGFDFRRIAGPLDVEPDLYEVLRTAPANQQLIRHLVRGTVNDRPPTGFFRDLVVEAKGAAANLLDVKRAGITPITNIARIYAIEAGITENRTLPRLQAAADMARITEDTRAGLEESFRLMWQIRLEHQAAQVRRGAEPDDDVDPRRLGPLTRQGLREAFGLIDRVQQTLAAEVGLRR